MNVSVEDLLKTPDRKLVFVEPWTRISVEGEEVSCCVEMRISVRDAIAYSRRRCHEAKVEGLFDDEYLLGEFMAVHWATAEADLRN